MRFPLVLLILCLLGGIVGIAVLVSGQNEAPPPPTASNAAADAAASSAAEAVAATEATAEAADPATSDAADADGDGAERSEADVATSPGQLVQVRVSRGNPPAAVEGVTVFFVSEAQARKRLAAAVPRPRIEWPESFGQRAVTDRDGLAQLPLAQEPWLVGAAANGEFAFAIVPPGPRTVDMLLQRDETLALAVTNGDGSPGAGIPTAVLQHHDGDGQATEIWQGSTDGAGSAVVPHFQLTRLPVRGAAEKERFAAMLVMALPVPAVAEFAGRPAPADPVRLVVPAHSNVDVLLTDHRGKALLSPAMVALWVERAPDFAPPFAVPGHLDRPRQSKPVGTAPVRFSLVGAGSQVRIGARFATDERRGAVSESLLAPLQPGAVLQTTLPLPAHLAVLAGRIVGEDGKPFGMATITGCFWRADRPLAQVTVHTIGDGHFDLVQRPFPDAPELWLELRTTIADGEQRREVGARVKFQTLREGQRTELGEIVLGELPGLCSGIVVDDLDVPVANAEVFVQRRLPPQPPPMPQGNQLPNRRAPPPNPSLANPSPANTEEWGNVPLLHCRSGADGCFVMLGVLPQGDLRVRADTDQHFAASLPLRTIGQQLRIRIDRNGVLRGRVLLPGFIADGSVTLTLRPFDETLRSRDTRSLGLSRQNGGRFTLEPLRPGRYDVVVAVRNVPEPLCVCNDVWIVPGESRDGRFRPLDLRQSLFRYRLRAVDAAGRTMALDGPILARVRRLDGSVQDAGFRWQRGRAELITGSSFANLVLFGRGCATQALSIGPGDHDVYMQQLVPAQLELPGARMLCGPERRVRVSTILVEETGYPQHLAGQDQRTGESYAFPRWELGKSNGAWLGVSDFVEVPLTRPGKYEVVLRIHATASERSPQASVPLGTYDLRVDGGARLPVTVPVDAQKVQEALATLQQQQQRAGRNPRGGRGQ